jgi:putative phosphoribosyl transferase
MTMPYRDRFAGGEALAKQLAAYANRPDVLVLALPRGGVPVGYAVARALRAPLDVYVVRKLGVPGHEELAMGAIASGGVEVLNPGVIDMLRVPRQVIDTVAAREAVALRQGERAYRDDRPPPEVAGKTVLLVDDGLATGASMRAAAAALRALGAGRIVVAVPVASRETCDELRSEVDEVVCALTPEPFRAVGLWYQDFAPVSDDEVRDLLRRAAQIPAGQGVDARTSDSRPDPRLVHVPADGTELAGDLTVPVGARGVVLFAHGSGSSRHSPRNRAVAETLQDGGFATLLLDLLTPEEEDFDIRTARLRFDIGLLARRLVAATDWLTAQPETAHLRIDYFGASTGAAAALVAAAERQELVGAVVSRGGRPDLAGDALDKVRAPTLLIVGGNDTAVIEMNRAALARLRGERQLQIISGASHLFEEPGALEAVARLALDWFQRYLPPPETPAHVPDELHPT